MGTKKTTKTNQTGGNYNKVPKLLVPIFQLKGLCETCCKEKKPLSSTNVFDKKEIRIIGRFR